MSYFKQNSNMLSNLPFCSSSDDLAEDMAEQQVFHVLTEWLDGKESYESAREALDNLELLHPMNSYVVKFIELFDSLKYFDDFDYRRECGSNFIKEVKSRL